MFSLYGALTFLAVIPMARFPRFALLIFGFVSALCFVVTGLKYHLRHLRTSRLSQVPASQRVSIRPDFF